MWTIKSLIEFVIDLIYQSELNGERPTKTSNKTTLHSNDKIAENAKEKPNLYGNILFR